MISKFASALLITLLMLIQVGCYRPWPIDTYYPNPLRGKFDNHTYRTYIGERPGNGWFRVNIPQEDNDYEHPFIVKNEIIGPDYTIVSLGPAVADSTVYRILVGKKCGSIWGLKHNCWPFMLNLLARGFDRQMDKIFEDSIRVDGYPALYEVYVQKMVGYYNYIGMWQPGEITLTHAVYFIDYGRYGAILWIQTSSDSGYNTVNDSNRFQIIHRTWKPLKQFIRSFVINGCYDRPNAAPSP